MEPGGGGEVGWALVDGEPAAAAAVRVDEPGGGGAGGVDVIEEAAVDELAGLHGDATVRVGEGVLVTFC